MSHYPIFADLNRRAVLLAGAGQVAERKAESLLHAGAALRVVAAELNPRFQGWLQQGRIEWLGPDFQTAFLIFDIKHLQQYFAAHPINGFHN